MPMVIQIKLFQSFRLKDAKKIHFFVLPFSIQTDKGLINYLRYLEVRIIVMNKKEDSGEILFNIPIDIRSRKKYNRIKRRVLENHSLYLRWKRHQKKVVFKSTLN